MQVGGSFEVLVVGPELFYGGDMCDREQAVFEPVFTFDEMLIPEGEFVLDGQLLIGTLHYITKQINLQQRYIINKRAMERNKGSKSQSFLQKFEGRKKVVGKEGVLLLLEQKVTEMESRKRTILSNHEQKTRKQESHSLPNKLPQIKSVDRQRQPLSNHETLIGPRSQGNALQKQYLSPKRVASLEIVRQHKRQVKSQQLMGGKQKLPTLNKKQQRSRSSKRMEGVPANIKKRFKIQKGGVIPSRSNRIERLSEKIMQQMVKLDSQALKHLQSLDSFQRLIMKHKLQSSQGELLPQLR